MAVSINCSQSNVNTPASPAFKGKWDRTDNGNPYYKTNSGTIAGSVLAVPAGLMWLSNLSLPTTEEALIDKQNQWMSKLLKPFTKGMNKEELEEFTNITKEAFEQNKDLYKKQLENSKILKKMAIPCALIAAGFSLACGMFVDSKRNQKAKEMADTVQQLGIKRAALQNDNIAISNKGHAYYESNDGSKYGALLGAGCGALHGLMASPKKPAIGTIIFAALEFALGGWIMGKIADSNNNKDAKKHV